MVRKHELREEYLHLVQQWEVEEGKPVEEDQLSSAQAKPEPPPYLSSLLPAPSAPSRWVISRHARCNGCKRSSRANGVGSTCWPLCLALLVFSVPVPDAAVPNAFSWKRGCVFVWQSSAVLKFAPMLWRTHWLMSTFDTVGKPFGFQMLFCMVG